MVWPRTLAYITATVVLPQKPRTVRPALQQSLECDGGGQKMRESEIT